MQTIVIKLAIFSVAFGFVEASVVVYLRHLLGASQPAISPNGILFLVPGIAFLEPRTALEIITDTQILNVERIREASTVVMLASIAALSGKNFSQKIAYFFFIFGIWDIFYYIFLNLTIGWPKSPTDLDIFFLLPTPWVGPIVVPIAMSSVLIVASLIFLAKRR